MPPTFGIRGLQGGKGHWITPKEAQKHTVGNEAFWEYNGAEGKVVPLTQHERPIWMYENGDMYLGDWKWHHESGRFVEDGFGITYVGGSTARCGMIHVGYLHFGVFHGLGKETWLSSSLAWRENKSPSSCIEQNGVSLPYTYEGNFHEDMKEDTSAKVTLKYGMSRVGEWVENEAVGDFWNDHDPVNAQGLSLAASTSVEASQATGPSQGTSPSTGKHTASQFGLPMNKKARFQGRKPAVPAPVRQTVRKANTNRSGCKLPYHFLTFSVDSLHFRMAQTRIGSLLGDPREAKLRNPKRKGLTKSFRQGSSQRAGRTLDVVLVMAGPSFREAFYLMFRRQVKSSRMPRIMYFNMESRAFITPTAMPDLRR